MLNLIYKICKYKELNADTIFYACKEDIPILEKTVEKIISDLNEQGY